MHDEKRIYIHYRGAGFAVKILLGIAGMFLFALVFGYAVQLLWNWIIPGIFNLKQIDYWQGFGIVLLSRILFGTILPPHPSHRFRKKFHEPCGEEEDNMWYMRGGWNKWKYYNKYWKEEGKASFEKYIEKFENEQKEKDTQKPE